MAGAHLEPRNISTLSTIVHDSFCSHSLTSRIMHSPYAFPDLEHKIFYRQGIETDSCMFTELLRAELLFGEA